MSRKEVTWILKFTKNVPGGGKLSPLSAPQRIMSYVKLPLSLMICGNTWFWNHRRNPDVSWSLSRSLPIYSRYLSKLHGGIHWCSIGISALDWRRSTHLITIIMQIPYINLIIGPRQWFMGPGCANCEYDREPEQLQAHLESAWFCKRWCWNIYWIGKCYQRGKSFLHDTPAQYLTLSAANFHGKKQCFLASMSHTKFAPFLLSMTNRFGSISRPKKNLTNQW